MIIHSTRHPSASRKTGWLRKLAWAAPLFFLLKGLLWLAAPLFLALYGLE